MKVLLDHHLKKQGILLWATMGSEGWLKLLDIPMLTFEDVGLPIDSRDRDVWALRAGKAFNPAHWKSKQRWRRFPATNNTGRKPANIIACRYHRHS